MVNENTAKEKWNAIHEMKNQIDKPKEEIKKIKLIKNTYKVKDEKIEQYKVGVPLKFLNLAGITDENSTTTAIYNKETNEINIQIKKNDK